MPLLSTTIAPTLPLALGLKVALAAPVAGSNLAIRLRACPPMVVKPPPTMGLPLLSKAIALTEKPFALGLKVASATPVVAFNLAIRELACPPMLVKEPPTMGLSLLSKTSA